MKQSKKTNSRKIADRKPKPDARAVVITMVVDESGSMAHLFDATCAGFNEYVAGVKRDLVDRHVHFSAITFDTRGIRKLQTGVPMGQAIALSRENYCPTGGTPLLDAVGQAIRATEAVHDAGNFKDARTVVVIQTDGQENASEEFKLADIKLMIEERQGKGWEFVFIGAGINAFMDAARMGINTMNTMSYSADTVGTQAVYAAMASNTTRYGTGNASGMNFSLKQSADSGEHAHITAAKLKSAHPSTKPNTTEGAK